jgi:Beta-lactamase superfamily domain
MAEIGRRYGPVDLAMIPIGGYRQYPRLHPNHVNLEEALRLLADVDGRLMVPMHYATFAMNREPFREPSDRLTAEALRRGDDGRIAVLRQARRSIGRFAGSPPGPVRGRQHGCSQAAPLLGRRHARSDNE